MELNSRNADKNSIRFNWARLKEARMARGLSMAELADAIGVSRQAVSQYENDGSIPSAFTMAKIIDVLNFPLSFFTAKDDGPEPPSSAIFFRSLKSATRISRDSLSVRTKWMWRIYSYLDQFVTFPSVNMPNITNNFDLDNLTLDDIEEIAIALRRAWGLGLGPISDMTLLLEKNGCVVSRFQFNVEKMDGFSKWINGRPYVFLASDKGSAVRTRYDDAHELGHLVLHSHIDESQLADPKVLKKCEDEANAFAAAFLMPAETFANEVFSASIDHFVTLKRRWKVSIAAMVLRCDRLGLFSENRVIYLHQQMSRRRMKTWEPLDDELPIESPRVFGHAIQMVIKNGVQSVADIVDQIQIHPAEIEELCSLPFGTLNMDAKVIPMRFRSE